MFLKLACLPVVTTGWTGVRDAEVNFHMSELFGVSTHTLDEALNLSVFCRHDSRSSLKAVDHNQNEY